MSSSAAAGQGTATCPGCEASTEESRCGHCGVALRAGGYRVLRVLSQGPHARLYLAEDEEGRRVALKELLVDLNPAHNPSVSLGGVKGQRHGFHGEIWSMKLQRGVMEKQSGDRCSFSLRMNR